MGKNNNVNSNNNAALVNAAKVGQNLRKDMDKLTKQVATLSLKQTATPKKVALASPIRSRKEQKKARKALLAKEHLSHKSPHMSKNPTRQVAKNTLVMARGAVQEAMARKIEKIILTVSAPKEFPPERLGSTFGSYPTAITNPFAVHATKQDNFVDNQLPVFLFRDPRRFCVYPQLVPYNATSGTIWFEYKANYASNAFTVGLAAMALPGQPAAWLNGPQMHGPVVYPGRYRGSFRSFYWLSDTARMLFQNINSAGMVINVQLLKLTEAGNVSPVGNPIACANAVSTNIPSTGAGYYAIEIAGATGVTDYQGSITFTEYTTTILPTVGKLYLWRHLAVPDQNKADDAAEAMKLYGASLMWTNQASPLNRQGKIAAVQIPQGRDWRSFLQFDTVARQRDAYTSNAVNGYYGFLKPTQPNDIDFIENNTHTGGSFQTGWWDADVRSDYLALIVQIDDLDGQDGYLTIAAALEFRTSDQWRETETPTATPEVVMKAMSIVSKLQQHHENPLHLSDILGAIRGFFSDVWDGIKETVPVVADVAHKTASIAMAVAPFL